MQTRNRRMIESVMNSKLSTQVMFRAWRLYTDAARNGQKALETYTVNNRILELVAEAKWLEIS